MDNLLNVNAVKRALLLPLAVCLLSGCANPAGEQSGQPEADEGSIQISSEYQDNGEQNQSDVGETQSDGKETKRGAGEAQDDTEASQDNAGESQSEAVKSVEQAKVKKGPLPLLMR